MTRTDDGSPCKLAVFNPVTGGKYLFVDENMLYSQWDTVVLCKKKMMAMATTQAFTQMTWRLLECMNECFIAILVLQNCSCEVQTHNSCASWTHKYVYLILGFSC